MPKGDYEKLIADPEDGTTQIAHLLLEAVAIAELNGKQKGLILYLWRRTYGWRSGDGSMEKHKEARITLKEWAAAVNSKKSYISKILNDLVEKNIIIRKEYKPGKTPVYSMNTRVIEWDRGCVNVEQLRKNSVEGFYKHGTQGFRDRGRVDKAGDQPPQGIPASLNKGLNKDLNNIRPDSKSPDTSSDFTEKAENSAQEEIPRTPDTQEQEIKYQPDSMPYRSACYLIDKILENNSRARVPVKDPTDPLMVKWCAEMDRLNRLGPPGGDDKGYSWAEIGALIDWCQADSFWSANILSAAKFREKAVQLENQKARASVGVKVKTGDEEDTLVPFEELKKAGW